MPPKPPPLEPDDTEPLPPREPAETVPELRLAVPELLRGAELMLLPAEAMLTAPATVAALLVAALTRALASEADLVVAATPPPVPEDWPDTADRDAWRAVLRESVWADWTLLGEELDGAGGGE